MVQKCFDLLIGRFVFLFGEVDQFADFFPDRMAAEILQHIFRVMPISDQSAHFVCDTAGLAEGLRDVTACGSFGFPVCSG